MRPSSAKAKGRVFQQAIRDMILDKFPSLTTRDVRSTGMGQSGMDIQLSQAASELFPYAVECKNVEKLNVWAAYNQACENTEDLEPLLIMKRNRQKPLVVVDAEYFFKELI